MISPPNTFTRMSMVFSVYSVFGNLTLALLTPDIFWLLFVMRA
ncbi:hypothetical protein SALWKB12_2087 [Snodgrassella communis]|nr:hypothetical protein SALWKB12_2276 [Snodgrassella communis]KDN11591.1 hypothetical protein SALWKB12_2087 [Snodgrassella communis]